MGVSIVAGKVCSRAVRNEGGLTATFKSKNHAVAITA